MSRRTKFTVKEDERLKSIVGSINGPISWTTVAKKFANKNAKQCRDRWTNYLSSNFKTQPWTDEEDARLMNLVDLMGHRWVAISHHMTGRSANNIKNHWHKELSKRKLETDGLQAPLRQMSCDIPSTMSHAFDLFEAMSDGSASDLDFAATGYSHKQ